MRMLSDVYMTILFPAAVAKPESFVLFKAPSRRCEQNAGLDVNHDGQVTKGESASKVQTKLAKGSVPRCAGDAACAAGATVGTASARHFEACFCRKSIMGCASALSPTNLRHPMANSAALAEIEGRIQIVEDNLRQLQEQAAAYSGAADEERNADRIAQQEAKLEALLNEREALIRKGG
jgi:hypothetical protein